MQNLGSSLIIGIGTIWIIGVGCILISFIYDTKKVRIKKTPKKKYSVPTKIIVEPNLIDNDYEQVTSVIFHE